MSPFSAPGCLLVSIILSWHLDVGETRLRSYARVRAVTIEIAPAEVINVCSVHFSPVIISFSSLVSKHIVSDFSTTGA